MCLYSRLANNKKYESNKKNGGVIPTVFDKRVLKVAIGCGRCMECRKQEQRKWQVRLLEDVRHNKNGKFITLTFSDESIKDLTELAKFKTIGSGKNKTKVRQHLKGYELDNEIATIAMRRFMERWRKEYKKSLRHWFITELGHEGTENIHMHGIVWTDETVRKIRKHWKYGFIHTDEKNGWVNEQTVNYITKYVGKQDNDHKEYKAKVLTSAGIGGEYVKRMDAKRNKYVQKNGWIKTNEAYRTRSGHEIAMPAYWRNKIYSEEEREKLWLEKLDENIRWVNGIKIDISKGEENYYKVLERERQRNKRLGYGNDEKNWKREIYEEERRVLMTEKRIKRAEDKTNVRPSGGSPRGGASSLDDIGWSK